MPQIIHVVDAFTDQPFAGNPAAVCVTSGPVDETWMKLVAREMNLSETAFVHPLDGGYSLRWLTPAAGVNEDPVTGSAHCALAPYWQAKLGKSAMIGYQASERGGVVHTIMNDTVVKGDRVLLQGNAVLMSRVELMSPATPR